MSIVEDVGAPRRWLKSKGGPPGGGPQGEGPQGGGPPDEAPQDAPLVGWLVTVVIVGVQAIAAAMASQVEDAATALGEARGAVMQWGDGNGLGVWVLIFFFLTFYFPWVLIPGAFGSTFAKGTRFSQWLPSMPRRRWLVAGGIAGLALLFDAASYLIADDGFALPDRAVWVRGGQEMGSAPWSQASGVTLGCEMQGRHSDSPTLIYQAHFPGGRSAKLGLGWASPQSVTNWLEAITPLDAALGKAPFEQGEMNARCLTAFNGAAGSEADQARLKALLRLP